MIHNVPNPTVVCVFCFCQALLNVHTVWSFNPVFTAWIFHTCSVNNPVMHSVALGWEIQRAAGVRCTRRSQLFREVVPTRAVNCEMWQTFAVTVCRHCLVNYWSIHIDVLYPLSTHFLPRGLSDAHSLTWMGCTSRSIRGYFITFFGIGTLFELWLITF